jgi:hypothetical protein
VTTDLIAFPAHALLILEERLAGQEAQGVEMPDIPRDELALRILIAAELLSSRDELGTILWLFATAGLALV